MKLSLNAPCPCGSGSKYKKCCYRYHKGASAPDALTLMKSRYSAYAVGNADYIIKTTHPDNSDYTKDILSWRASIREFSDHTVFEGLRILAYDTGEEVAFVTFEARLSSGLLKEKSHFLKASGRWLYVDGEVAFDGGE